MVNHTQSILATIASRTGGVLHNVLFRSRYMARKIRSVTFQELEIARADNYRSHYERREFVKTWPADLLAKYQAAVAQAPQAVLSLAGADHYSDDDLTRLVEVANQYGVDAWLLNAWYLFPQGWEIFQSEWANLPELVHIGLCTTRKVVPAVHRQELEPAYRRQLYPKRQ
jgi:hypothetical protein